MSDKRQVVSVDASPQVGPQFESDEINSGLLTVIGVFLAVAVVLIVVLLQAWFYNWKEDLATARNLPSNDPQTLLGRVMVEHQEQLNGNHWINRDAKVLAIPIDRAMDLVAKEMAAEQAKLNK
jgi:hypothetical protein